MKRYLTVTIALIAAASFIIGCKPSAKNEVQYWENNKKDFAEAVAKYPNFKDVLDKKMAEAQKIWDEAEKASGDDAKAEKMKAANEKLNELLNQFTQIKFKSQGIEDAIAKLNAKKLTTSEDVTRTKAVNAARAALKDVAAMLAAAKVTGDEDAKKVTDDAISKLIGAQGDIDRAAKSLEPAKTAAPAKKK
jgi:hypothetical protein